MRNKIWILIIMLAFSVQAMGVTNSGSFIDTIYEAEEADRGVSNNQDYSQEQCDAARRSAANARARALPTNQRGNVVQPSARPAPKTRAAPSNKRILDYNKIREEMDAIHSALEQGGATETVQPVALRTIPGPGGNLSAEQIFAIMKGYGVEILGGIKDENNPNGMWTREQLYYLWRAYVSVPPKFRQSTKQFQRVTSYGNYTSVLGYVYAGIPRVYLTNTSVRPRTFEKTIIHEMAHCWAFDPKNKAVYDKFKAQFWSADQRSYLSYPVSSYGRTNYHEDFAEAVRYYWENGAEMRAKYPERFEFIRVNVFGSYRAAGAQVYSEIDAAGFNQTRQY